jgi:ribonuclease Z
LINGPFHDPGLFIPFHFQNRALLFDIGDIRHLPAKDILKISHVFVTHTHMDHFIGFDQLLRIMLGREKTLSFYGPQDFMKHVEGKLSGYNWNLVGKYNYPLALQVTEVHPEVTLCRRYRCLDRFRPLQDAVRQPLDDVLHREPPFSISATILDHQIPCLGLSLREKFHVNIIKEGLNRLELEPGPWLTDFKQAIYSRTDPAAPFEVNIAGQALRKRFELGSLTEQIARITPGQKITYITDVAYTDPNRENIVELARNSDYLYIEAAFMQKDRGIAAQKHHLTAHQAGKLAARAGVKQFTIFHFSSRYAGQEDLLYQEAMEAFERFA